MGTTTFKAVYVSGVVEDVEGVPIEGTPFFAHECEAESGEKCWRVTHAASGAAISPGWYKLDDAVLSVRTWWRELSDAARDKMESVTADSLEDFAAWKKDNWHEIGFDRISELCDFYWERRADGGI